MMLAVLTTMAALAAGPSTPPPDPPCPNCIAAIELVPVKTSAWPDGFAYDQRFYHGGRPDPKTECNGLTPDECTHERDPIPAGTGYSDKYTGITLDAVDLSYAFHPGKEALEFYPTVNLTVHIELFDGRAEYDPSQIRVTNCGATGSESPPLHVEWETKIFDRMRTEPCDTGFACAIGSDRPHRDKIISAVLTIDADPATIATCTIDFSRGSDVTDPPIPPLTFRRYAHYFPEIMI